MASVTALRTRIEELSLAIRRHKKTRDLAKLRDLEQKKSGVQSDLNRLLDPMERIPLELSESSDIFMRCLRRILDPDPNAAPMVFMGVCRAWSTIAISTPSLWAAIRVRESDGGDLEANRTRLMNIWLTRARNRPLFISLHGDLNSGIWQTMHRNAHQVQNLKLYLPSAHHLEHILATPLPSLKTLLIGKGHDNGDDSDDSEAGYSGNLWIEKYYSFDARESVEMLRAVPGLVDCKFYDIHYEVANTGAFDAEPELTHFSLKHLYLDPTALILQSLTLPVLETLYLYFLPDHQP
ncbi:hypothetical protein DFH09DRAFT_1367784 [Mycena vulgaris]|nr:hypothetical protein DFH09DRAFT_1367784 [Mycena vulgaris]